MDKNHRWVLIHLVFKDEHGLDQPAVDWRCGRCEAYRRGSTAWRADGLAVVTDCLEESARVVLES